MKITSGSTKAVGKWVDMFYGSIIKAGTHLTKDIKTAEAAKIIENTQRDINIALMNELAIIFKLLKIDTLDIFRWVKKRSPTLKGFNHDTRNIFFKIVIFFKSFC